jgi:hypothetical protein
MRKEERWCGHIVDLGGPKGRTQIHMDTGSAQSCNYIMRLKAHGHRRDAMVHAHRRVKTGKCAHRWVRVLMQDAGWKKACVYGGEDTITTDRSWQGAAGASSMCLCVGRAECGEYYHR